MKPQQPSLLLISLSMGIAFPVSAASLSLSGTDHTGYAAALGVNPEFNGFTDDPSTISNPNNPHKPSAGMPYYYDTTKNMWTWLVTTPLSSSNDYSGLGIGTVRGTASNDVNFGTTNFGSLTYDDGHPATGTITIPASAFAFNLADLGPMNAFYGRTNYNTASNNEFNWDYAVYTATGNVDLTFTNGVISSIDGTLNIGVAIRFLGMDAGAFASNPDFWMQAIPATYDGTLTFSGDTFAFDVDEEIPLVYSALGNLTNTRLVINRTGTIDGVSPVPEPSVALLGFLGSLALLRRKR